jgi:hypothetical protein
MENRNLKPLVVAMLMPVLAFGTSTIAVADTVQEKITTSPVRTVTPREEQILSSAAVKVLRHIAEARGDIHSKQLTKAETELGKADTLLEIITSAAPTMEVKDRIWVANKHLEYEDTKDVLPELVPIYDSLDEIIDYVPAKAARKQLDKARKNLERGNKKASSEELKAAEAALVVTEADLPLKTVRTDVSAARAFLAKKQLDQADKVLRAAEDSVVLFSMGTDSQLNHAQSSVGHAVRNYAQQAGDAAKSDVKQAIRYLQNATHEGDQETRKAVSALLAEAQQVETQLDRGDKKTESALTRLWERTKALSERSGEYAKAGWDRLTIRHPGASDLIEAKLHLSYAEIDSNTGGPEADRLAELEQTASYLAAASSRVDKPMQERVDRLSREVSQLGSGPQERQRYEQMLAQLGQIIRSM